MKSLAWSLFSQALAGAIVFAGLVVVVFALTGQWPPQEMFVGASIGGALSPLFWRSADGRLSVERQADSR